MKIFEYIDNDQIKKQILDFKKQHEDITEIYRLIRGNNITAEEFLPSLYDANQPNSKDKNNIKHYSCSLLNYKAIKNKIHLPYYKSSFQYLAIGDTNSNKGISLPPNSSGHVDYFLYDFKKNNPYVDFKLGDEIK